jgi:hypothetical protein
MNRYLFIIVLLTASLVSFGQIVPGGIVHAFEKGDARELAKFFHDNLEIKLLDEEYVASKNQATRILQEFFKHNPPVSFKVNYEGTKKDSKYGLGTLTTTNDSFRINLYFMEGKKDKIIYFLSIEKI